MAVLYVKEQGAYVRRKNERVLVSKGVDVNYFSRSGKYLGCTAAEASKNIFLRLA